MSEMPLCPMLLDDDDGVPRYLQLSRSSPAVFHNGYLLSTEAPNNVMYCVVEFVNDKSVAAVAQAWFVNKHSVMWPKNPKQRDYLLQNNLEPPNGTKVYSVRIRRENLSLEKAKKLEKTAEETDDLSTSEPTVLGGGATEGKAIRRNTSFNNCSADFIRRTAIDWFHGAKDRYGHRSKRREATEKVLQHRNGGQEDPFAVRTPLGWVIFGPVAEQDRQGVNDDLLSEKDIVTEKLEKMWNFEFGEPKPLGEAHSIDGKIVLELFESLAHLTRGHLEITLP
ncbi:unnamed protein product [Schistocephalus solidus]|uniref:Uncharacterized protein n=1 Tax=Schistocephalus solidus TaxID=70667 RepID=A0A183SLY4_SCHSO|nr:unnamed protein product [Schistocephalus solidus]